MQKLQRATTLVTQQGTKQLQQMTLSLHQMLTNVKLEELLILQQCSETGVDLRHSTTCLFFKLCIRLSKWFYRLALSRKPLVPKLYDVTEDEACLRRPFKSPHPNATGFSQVNRMVRHRSQLALLLESACGANYIYNVRRHFGTLLWPGARYCLGVVKSFLLHLSRQQWINQQKSCK